MDVCSISRNNTPECLVAEEIDFLKDIYIKLYENKVSETIWNIIFPVNQNTNMLSINIPKDILSMENVIFLKYFKQKEKAENIKDLIGKVLPKFKKTQYESILIRIQKIAFKPDWDKSPNSWLSASVLIRLMDQITNFRDNPPKELKLMDTEKSLPLVKNFGIVTYDFNIKPYLVDFGDPKEIYLSFEKEGWDQGDIMLNTDHRYGKGIHWVCMCVNINKETKIGTIEYFDSTGKPPRSGVLLGTVYNGNYKFHANLPDWINRLKIIFCQKGYTMTDIYCSKLQQDDPSNGACGAYCILYLHARALNINFEEFMTDKISNEQIAKYRKKIYNPVL